MKENYQRISIEEQEYLERMENLERWEKETAEARRKKRDDKIASGIITTLIIIVGGIIAGFLFYKFL